SESELSVGDFPDVATAALAQLRSVNGLAAAATAVATSDGDVATATPPTPAPTPTTSTVALSDQQRHCRELSESERQQILLSDNFQAFFARASRVVERALAETETEYFETDGEADAGSDAYDEGAVAGVPACACGPAAAASPPWTGRRTRSTIPVELCLARPAESAESHVGLLCHLPVVGGIPTHPSRTLGAQGHTEPACFGHRARHLPCPSAASSLGACCPAGHSGAGQLVLDGNRWPAPGHAVRRLPTASGPGDSWPPATRRLLAANPSPDLHVVLSPPSPPARALTLEAAADRDGRALVAGAPRPCTAAAGRLLRSDPDSRWPVPADVWGRPEPLLNRTGCVTAGEPWPVVHSEALRPGPTKLVLRAYKARLALRPLTSPEVPSQQELPRSAPGSETGAKQPADFGTTSSAASSSAKPAKSSTMSTATTSSTTTAGTSSTTKRKPANRDKTQKTDAAGSGQLPIESGIKELPLDQSAGGADAKNHFGGSGSGDTNAGSSHFMVYMLVAIFLFGFLYVLYHKKQKSGSVAFVGPDWRHQDPTVRPGRVAATGGVAASAGAEGAAAASRLAAVEAASAGRGCRLESAASTAEAPVLPPPTQPSPRFPPPSPRALELRTQPAQEVHAGGVDAVRSALTVDACVHRCASSATSSQEQLRLGVHEGASAGYAVVRAGRAGMRAAPAPLANNNGQHGAGREFEEPGDAGTATSFVQLWPGVDGLAVDGAAAGSERFDAVAAGLRPARTLRDLRASLVRTFVRVCKVSGWGRTDPAAPSCGSAKCRGGPHGPCGTFVRVCKVSVGRTDPAAPSCGSAKCRGGAARTLRHLRAGLQSVGVGPHGPLRHLRAGLQSVGWGPHGPCGTFVRVCKSVGVGRTDPAAPSCGSAKCRVGAARTLRHLRAGLQSVGVGPHGPCGTFVRVCKVSGWGRTDPAAPSWRVCKVSGWGRTDPAEPS
uniref:WD_REPEATS_REGION domain-containing protein n=1 Tax=Macrostomum lignano TaxID=282301 RepID=A0A1I8ILX4_9PLAT